MLDEPTDSSSVQNSPTKEVDSENSGSFDEIRSFKQAKWKSYRDQYILIITLLFIGVAILSYTCYYLMQFKVDQVNQFLNAGIEQLEQKKEIHLPIEAKIQLSENYNSNPIFWDSRSKNWMVQIGDQPSSLFNFKIIPVSALKDLEDLGFYWEDGEWIKKQPATGI